MSAHAYKCAAALMLSLQNPDGLESPATVMCFTNAHRVLEISQTDLYVVDSERMKHSVESRANVVLSQTAPGPYMLDVLESFADLRRLEAMHGDNSAARREAMEAYQRIIQLSGSYNRIQLDRSVLKWSLLAFPVLKEEAAAWALHQFKGQVSEDCWAALSLLAGDIAFENANFELAAVRYSAIPDGGQSSTDLWAYSKFMFAVSEALIGEAGWCGEFREISALQRGSTTVNRLRKASRKIMRDVCSSTPTSKI